MFYPKLLCSIGLFSLLATLPCDSTGQGKRPLDRYQNPMVTATDDPSSLTARLKSMKSQALYTAQYYIVFTLPQQVQENLPTGYRQPNLHGLSSQLNLRGYASSIQPPNPPLFASTSGNQPDTTGMYIPDSSNAVRVEVKQVGARAWFVHRTMNFPPFTGIDDFNQTVLKMNLPGDPLTHDMIGIDLKSYRTMLEYTHFHYAALSRDATPHSIVIASEKQVRIRVSNIKTTQRASGRFTLFEKNRGEGHRSSVSVTNAFMKAEAIVIIYCRKSDVNTYFEVLWYPNHPEYSVQRVLAYLMRKYEGVTSFGIKTDGDYENFLDVLQRAMNGPPSDICSKFVGGPLTLPSA